MEQSLQVTKHFFKVMSRDFHAKMALPKAFCRNLDDKKLATIRSGKGIWKICVGKSNRDTMFFEEGWGDFVRQHELTVGDIVVFEHVGGMDFNAFVFDYTACEKEFDDDLAEKYEGSSGVCNNLEAIRGGSCQQRDNPYFVITMKHSHSPASKRSRPFVQIPAEFWKSNDLKMKKGLNLKDPSSKKWSVQLKYYSSGRVVMDRGWKQFYESNKLKKGDVCTFELNHNPKGSTVASMDVHIFPAPN
ncbi:B3 domain-containing Os01g0723500-like [Olea europaea subsp. europaea]|uniref:B3 domain-containing Os01g0723500-like n=1 Tax=Olea europaea subsp. europaea TaxID=158383 RepID=A0A8S0TE39_OLEEU|nr:B3 domain-containing Os01g0723500-like [Olea europaea subsp. europaea]